MAKTSTDNRIVDVTVSQMKRIADQTRRMEATPLNTLPDNNGRRKAKDGFWSKVTSSGNVSGNANRYQYAWTEQKRTSTGWVDMAGGRSGTVSTGFALNSIENPNKNAPASGDFYGNGVEWNDFQTLLPVQGNPVVWMEVENDDSGNAAYSFAYENAMSCT